jgi:hypothetical protein
MHERRKSLQPAQRRTIAGNKHTNEDASSVRNEPTLRIFVLVCARDAVEWHAERSAVRRLTKARPASAAERIRRMATVSISYTAAALWAGNRRVLGVLTVGEYSTMAADSKRRATDGGCSMGRRRGRVQSALALALALARHWHWHWHGTGTGTGTGTALALALARHWHWHWHGTTVQAGADFELIIA